MTKSVNIVKSDFLQLSWGYVERKSLRFEIPFELGHQWKKEEWKNKKEYRSFGLQVVSPRLRSTRLDDFNCFIDVL